MRSLTRVGLCALAIALSGQLFGSVALGVEVGDKAPDFSLPSTSGGEIRLSQFLGKKHVLIEFYVSNFRPT